MATFPAQADEFLRPDLCLTSRKTAADLPRQQSHQADRSLRRMRTRILLFGVSAFASVYTMAQGCSDAGVCSAGPIGQLHLWQDSTADVVDYRHYAKIQYSYAVGEQGVTIMQVQPEVSVGIGERFAVQVKVPYATASGNLGENSGLGDMVTSASYAFIKEEERNFTGIIGLRLPTGKTAPTRIEQAAFGRDARPLPMPYQTGLGTLDLLVGAQFRKGPWSVALAYQHVLNQDNQNTFLHSSWSGTPAALNYFESFALERADDAVVRVQYTYGCGRLALQPGLLAIQHLGRDSRLESTGEPIDLMGGYMFERREVDGSEGLTLNITADLRYKIAERWAAEVMFGTPVITREVRPDGLTRSLVTGFGLRYRF